MSSMNQDTFTLSWKWAELEAEYHRLAQGPVQAEMIRHLVNSLRKQAPFLNSETMLQEVLAIAACLADRSFPPMSEAYPVSGPAGGSSSLQ